MDFDFATAFFVSFYNGTARKNQINSMIFSRFHLILLAFDVKQVTKK